MKLRIFALLVLLLGGARLAFAYPEMVRHGYVNCATCHYSPNGGRLLTPYGRSLAREVLSTWGAEGEENFLYGLVALPETVQFGGDFRALQTYRDSNTARDARFFVMQAEVQAAATVSDVTIVGSLGYRPSTELKPGKLILPEHYISYAANPNFTVRLGKFARPYGIPYAEHYLSIKRRLGLERESELYHLQGIYTGDNFELPVTATLGSLSFEEEDERGITLRPALNLSHMKLGISYSLMKSNTKLRHNLGPWALIALSKRLTVGVELDWEWAEETSVLRSFSVGFVKVTYEFIKGFHGIAFDEMDYDRDGNAVHRPALGLQLFPRPHLEVQATYSKQFGERGFDQGLLLLHYYL